MDSFAALLIAWLTGYAAVERFDKGDVEVAYFLGALCVISLVGALVAWIVGKDDR